MDTDKQLNSQTARHKRTEKKLEIYEMKCAKYEDEDLKKDQKIGDLEF